MKQFDILPLFAGEIFFPFCWIGDEERGMLDEDDFNVALWRESTFFFGLIGSNGVENKSRTSSDDCSGTTMTLGDSFDDEWEDVDENSSRSCSCSENDDGLEIDEAIDDERPGCGIKSDNFFCKTRNRPNRSFFLMKIQTSLTVFVFGWFLHIHFDRSWRSLFFWDDSQNSVDYFQDAFLFVHLDYFDVWINTFIQ